MWPTLINTARWCRPSVKKDLLMYQSFAAWLVHHVIKIVNSIASASYVHRSTVVTGYFAWMVLIAAEMLAQNPGLGKVCLDGVSKMVVLTLLDESWWRC